MPMNLDKSTRWVSRGSGFVVEVIHHEIDPGTNRDDGGHRWNVYAYIYPAHPLFGHFVGDDMFQPAACSLPLHCGPSWLTWELYRRFNFDGSKRVHTEVGSVKVGSDYNHGGDEHCTWWATDLDATKVFNDAEELYSHLAAIALAGVYEVQL